jgi:drug/metabolite transporter (DMT)-like permease
MTPFWATTATGGTPVAVQMLVCSFLWGSSFLLMKAIGTDLSPLALTAARGVMGGALLALWLALLGQGIVPRGREWRDWAVLGVLQGVVPNTLIACALTEITAGLAAMILASVPLMVAVMAHGLFADERLTRQRSLGVLVGFAGMAILFGPASFTGSHGSALGMSAMTGAALSYSAGNLYVRSIPSQHPLRLAFGQQVFSGFPMLALVLAVSGSSAFSGIADRAVLLAVFGVFGTSLPIVIYMNILRIAGPTVGAMNNYLVPVWAVLLGVCLLNEAIVLREEVILR